MTSLTIGSRKNMSNIKRNAFTQKSKDFIIEMPKFRISNTSILTRVILKK